MRSSHPNTAQSPTGGVVPTASYAGLDPQPLPHDANPGNDLRSQLYKMCYNGRRFTAFLSILLGDDEVLDEGVTGNKRLEGKGVTSGTDHDTMQPHGGELAYPTSTLWLPENLKNRAATLGYKDGEEFITNMSKICREVLKFGARATHVAKAFARMEFYLVKHVLFEFNAKDLRVVLQGLVKLTDNKLPLTDSLLPDIIPSGGFDPSASYILKPRPPRVGSDAGDIPSQLRAKIYDSEQFYIFISILLGEDHPPDEDATVHDSGGALSVTDHDSLQARRASTTTVWLPEYLKKRDAISGYLVSQCWGQLMGPFKKVMKFGARTTDVAQAFARLKIEDVESLLEHPEDLLSKLKELDAIAEDNDTRELIKMFMPGVEIDPETDPNIDIPRDVLPETLLPDVEPIDDDYIKLSVFRYFGQM